MKSCSNALICACLMLSLAACHSNPVKRVPVFPDPNYLKECPIDYGDRSAQAVIEGLSSGIDCERADKKAIRCWVQEHGEEGEPRPDCKP